jgi:hypothetical protein
VRSGGQVDVLDRPRQLLGYCGNALMCADVLPGEFYSGAGGYRTEQGAAEPTTCLFRPLSFVSLTAGESHGLVSR